MSNAVETDPILRAEQLAEQEEKRRAASRKRLSGAKAQRDDDGSIIVQTADGSYVSVKPRAVFPDANLDDSSVIELADGTNPVKPGWCTRWVRTIDAEGRPTMARVNMYRRYGYEVILDTDKQPLKREHLMAMQGPPEALAALMVAKRRGSNHTVEQQFQHAAQVVESINREAGRRVMEVYEPSQNSRTKGFVETDGP